MTTPTTAAPPAPFHLNYRGDVRHMVGENVGPNTMGEVFQAVDAELVKLPDGTVGSRVGFVITNRLPQ